MCRIVRRGRVIFFLFCYMLAWWLKFFDKRKVVFDYCWLERGVNEDVYGLGLGWLFFLF